MNPDTKAQLDRAEDPAVTVRRKKEDAKAQVQAAADRATAALAPDTTGILRQEADRAAMLKAGVGPEAPAPIDTNRVYHPEADRAAMLRQEQGVLPMPAPEEAAPKVMQTPFSAPSPAITGKGPDIAEPAPSVDLGANLADTAPDRLAPAAAEPGWADKLKEIAKKTGMGILDLLQAGAYGYAGVNTPTRLQKEQEAEQREKEQAQQNAWQTAMIDQEAKHRIRQQEIEQGFQRALAEARNQWDVQAAKEQRDFTSTENDKTRANDLAIAKERFLQDAQAKGLTPEQAMQKFKETLRAAFGD